MIFKEREREPKDRLDLVIEKAVTQNLFFILKELFGQTNGKKIFNNCTAPNIKEQAVESGQPCFVLLPGPFLSWLRYNIKDTGKDSRIVEGSERLSPYILVKNKEILENIKEFINI